MGKGGGGERSPQKKGVVGALQKISKLEGWGEKERGKRARPHQDCLLSEQKKSKEMVPEGLNEIFRSEY